MSAITTALSGMTAAVAQLNASASTIASNSGDAASAISPTAPVPAITPAPAQLSTSAAL